jgi:hypothetical protein
MAELLTPDKGSELAGQVNWEFALGNPNLPIANHRAEIVSAIQDNSLVIITAPPGAGKSTQVPPYALEMSENGQAAFDSVIVTQPRIIAARKLSERLNYETLSSGERYSIGYYTSRESSPNPQRNQDLVILTDGKAAAQLLHEARHENSGTKRLLIIDEFHEGNLNIELLTALIGDKLNPRSTQYDENLKVVIMSATMDTDRLVKHFENLRPPVINVDVPTYPVETVVSNRPVEATALSLARETSKRVLVFQPGKGEIKGTLGLVAKKQRTVARPIAALALHGQQTAEEQSLAFKDYPHGSIVATTNVAETSLTVPDVVAVVDSGEVRVDEVKYHLVASGSTGLYLRDASQAELMQRRGRTGRTEPGKYVLASPVSFEDRIEFAKPAIQRQRLDSILLLLKATGREISDFNFYNQPPAEAVKAAQTRLYILGATDAKGIITNRGLEMEKLPLDPEYACMVAFANEEDNGYGDEVKQHLIDIAAIMNRGGILKRAPKEQAWRQLLKSDSSGDLREADSDYLAQLEAYIELTTNVDPKHYGDYDILEHAMASVQQDRILLARKLGVELHSPTPVAPENRLAVLTCINAGQLNQLWHRSGDTWQLVFGNGDGEYGLAPSSVGGQIGRLATGALFSLGLNDEVIHSIQDVNSVSLESVELLTRHLDLMVDTVHREAASFDRQLEKLVAPVTRRLGSITVRSFKRPIDSLNPNERAKASEAYREHAWEKLRDKLKAEKIAPRVYTDLDEIDRALGEPETLEYDTDPFSGESLIAYMGGHGRWCQSEAAARESLEAGRNRLLKTQSEAELRALKASIKQASTQLRALMRSDPSYTLAAKKILVSARKTDKQAWLEQANQLLSASTSEVD